MLKTVVAFFALTLFAATPARALPGQTPAQLLAWGKGNVALHGFKPSMDDETGGTVYMGHTTIDGMGADFSSEPVNGIARQEYIAFTDVSDSWTLAPHPALILDALRVVYGAAYVADFRAATRVPLKGKTIAWKGAKLSYAVMGAALFTVRNADFPAVLANIRKCDGLDCED